VSIEGATGIIINITGGSNLKIHEVNEATTLIMEAAHEDAEIIFGTVIDESMKDTVKVTCIATGLGDKVEQQKAVQVPAGAPVSRPEAAGPPAPTPEMREAARLQEARSAAAQENEKAALAASALREEAAERAAPGLTA